MAIQKGRAFSERKQADTGMKLKKCDEANGEWGEWRIGSGKWEAAFPRQFSF
jgi:hypothetical protein